MVALRLFGDDGRLALGDQGVTLLPLASLAVDEELFLGTPEEVLKTAFFQKSEALGHFGRRAKPWGYRGQQELRAPLLSAKSSLPQAMPCQHCTVAAIMRRRQLEEMWSKVLAGSRRILWVKFVGSCS